MSHTDWHGVELRALCFEADDWPHYPRYGCFKQLQDCFISGEKSMRERSVYLNVCKMRSWYGMKMSCTEELTWWHSWTSVLEENSFLCVPCHLQDLINKYWVQNMNNIRGVHKSNLPGHLSNNFVQYYESCFILPFWCLEFWDGF